MTKISLYPRADDSASLYHRLDTKIIVQHDGNCTWLAPIILKSECKINVEFFPFDEQSCTLTFGSWTYNMQRIDVVPVDRQADLSNYIENGEWEIIKVSAERLAEKFPCCPVPYSYVIYTLRIRRRTMYYVSNLIIPCGVIAALAFLSFYLPADSGERISLVITVLLAMTVYMLMVSNTMPPTSEVIPLIGKYYLAVMIEIALCLVATCITIKWHHNATPIPRWMHAIFVKFLGRILCVGGAKVAKSFLDVSSSKVSYNLNDNPRALTQISGCEMVNHSDPSSVQLREIMNNPSSPMESIHKDITVISSKVEMEQTEEGIRRDWQIAGEVLDRLFFIIFLTTFALVSIVIFIAIPKRSD